MKNKITLQTNSPKTSELSLLNERNLGRFICGAEEDYLLARVLLHMSIYDAGMYHYQQCMEKFFKSFLMFISKLLKGMIIPTITSQEIGMVQRKINY